MRLRMLDPFGFSLAGCRCQAVRFSRREKRTERCAGLPIFLFYFSFSMGCLLSFTKELQSKGTDTEDLGIIESHRVKTEIAEVFDAVRHETEALLLMKST